MLEPGSQKCLRLGRSLGVGSCLPFWKLGRKPAGLPFFFFFFIFKLYIIVLVLPNIKMNPPQVYMCSPF